MTVSDKIVAVQSTYSGGTTFAFNHPFLQTSDLLVSRVSVGIPSTLVLGVDYTVSGTPDVAGNYTGGGNVVISTPLISGDLITIERVTNPVQTAQYGVVGKFPAKVHESVLDKLTLLVQENSYKVSRSAKFNSYVPQTVSAALPDPSAFGVFRWNAAATAIEAVNATALFQNGTNIPTLNNTLIGDGTHWISTTPVNARTALGLVIGTNVQAWNATLDTFTAAAVTNNNILMANGTTWASVAPAAARTALGLAIGTDVQAWNAKLDTLTAAAVTNNNILQANGSTWLSVTPATARTNLGLAIGTNVQAWDADLDALAGLTSAADKVPYFTGSGAAAVATFNALGRGLVGAASANAAVNSILPTQTSQANKFLQTDGTNTSWATVPLPTLASTDLWVGNGSNAATAVTLSGDVTMANTGAVTIANNAVTTAKINAGAVTEAKMTLADNTTANVSTSAHGFAPKLPNDATKYMDGTGAYSVPAGSGLTNPMTTQYDLLTGGAAGAPTRFAGNIFNANLFLRTNGNGSACTNMNWEAIYPEYIAFSGSAIAINRGGTNATTANDAFNNLAPSQGSNSGKFLKTDGTNTSWASGGNGLVQIDDQTASANASMNFLTGIDGTYGYYELHFKDVILASNAQVLRLRVSENTGVTWRSTAGDYQWTSTGIESNSTTGINDGNNSDTTIQLTNNTGETCGLTPINGMIRIYSPANATKHKLFRFETNYESTNSHMTFVSGAAVYKGTNNAINGLEIYASLGNITSGRFTLYALGT